MLKQFLRLAAVAAALFASRANAQDLENFGTFTNTGLTRVKGLAVNLPDSLGGTFDYKNGNQLIAPRTYAGLQLLGTGVDSALTGVTVNSTIQIGPNIVFKIDTTSFLQLNGSISENGYYLGKLQSTINLSAANSATDFNGIGASLTWNTSGPGIVAFSRVTGSSIHALGTTSINRYYSFTQSTRTSFTASISISYNPIELNGQNPSALVLWQSVDNGASWRRLHSSVDTSAKMLSVPIITSLGMFTISDTLHPLGQRLRAFSVTSLLGNNQTGEIGAYLQPFTMVALAQDSTPVFGANVNFTVISAPAGARSETLSVVTAVTDDNGRASTTFRLGSKVGKYIVRAQADTASNVFNGFATHGPAAVFAASSGNGQSRTVTLQLNLPLVVTVTDTGGNPVPGVSVGFGLDSLPPNTSGATVTSLNSVTDTNGVSAAFVKFGNRSGWYRIKASSGAFAPAYFLEHALPAPAHTMALMDGNNQQNAAGRLLAAPFRVVLSDSFGNLAPGGRVNFGIVSAPPSAQGQSLSTNLAVSDTNGLAVSTLKLGTKPGVYTVTATGAGLAGSPITFTATANVGPPALFSLLNGDQQTGQVLDTLPQLFKIAVTDSNANPVVGLPVHFVVTSAPAGAAQDSALSANPLTDSTGSVSSKFVLGTIPGDYVVSVFIDTGHTSVLQFREHAIILYADANDDRHVNVADLTTIIDVLNGKLHLSPVNTLRADLDSNGVIDAGDEKILLSGLLGGKWDTVAAIAQGETDRKPLAQIMGNTDTTKISSTFEVTPTGLRFDLKTNVAIRGIEIILRLKTAAPVPAPEMFDIASFMSAPVKEVGNLVHVVVYNGANTELPPDTTTIMRLPIVLTDTSQFEIVDVVVSTHANSGIPITSGKLGTKPGLYPETFSLSQNYPNPFNNTTKIQYVVPDVPGKFAYVLVQVFDIGGRKIKTLAKGDHSPGTYTVTWDGTNDEGNQVATGVYLFRLWTSLDHMIVKKMMFMK
jgi:hypothetical protein